MNDEDYKKIKEAIKEKTDFHFEKDEDSYHWNVGFLSNIKDKNNKKSFCDFINLVRENIFNQTVNECIWFFEKNYIKIEDIPSSKDIYGIVSDRIKSHKASIKQEKIDLVKLERKKDKEKDYDKRRAIKSDIFWSEHRMEDYEKEITFYNHISESLKSTIKYKSKNKKFTKKGDDDE